MTTNQSEKQDPSESITIKIKEHSYVINFPNTGQLIDIENRKASLRPHNIEFATGSGLMANLLIDAVATFDILCPKMMTDLNVNVFDLNLIQSKHLAKAYLREFSPWYSEWIKIISNFDLI